MVPHGTLRQYSTCANVLFVKLSFAIDEPMRESHASMHALAASEYPRPTCNRALQESVFVSFSPDHIRGRRILIAEDEAMIALDLETVLEDLGCEIIGPVAN